MRKAVRYRLFKMGKMPESLAAVAAGDGVLLASEGLPVHNRVHSLRMPGARVGVGVRTASGAIVITQGRLLASIGRFVVVDTDFRPSGGKQTLELSDDGVRIKFDVASVLASGSGAVEVYYRLPLDERLLGQLPARSMQVTLSQARQALLNPWQGSWSGGRSAATGS